MNLTTRMLAVTSLIMLGASVQAATHEMPKLSIRWECGECATNPKVIPLIQQNYLEQVRKHGQTLASKHSAEIVITDFRQRPPTARALLGGFAGKDRLGVSIRYKGKSLVASDSAVTIMNGMNSLCKSVAQSTYRQLSQLQH